MRQRKETQGFKGWVARFATCPGSRNTYVNQSSDYTEITGRSIEMGKGLTVAEDHRKEKDRELTYFNISQKTEGERVGKAEADTSKGGSRTG